MEISPDSESQAGIVCIDMPKMNPVHYRLLIGIFEKVGFIYSRTKGDHMIFVKPGIIRALVIPMYENVPVFIIQNLLRTSGMTREEYFRLLGRS